MTALPSRQTIVMGPVALQLMIGWHLAVAERNRGWCVVAVQNREALKAGRAGLVKSL